MEKSKVVIRSVKDKKVEAVVQDILDRLKWKEIVKKNSKVVIKPNFCTPEKEKIYFSNTDPKILYSLCKILKTRTNNIIIGESDGLHYKAEETFENNGTYRLGKELGVKVISFSKDELVETRHPLLKGTPMPKTIRDADVFISMPVLKTHALTVFTGAVKNMWGCVPRFDRILLHKHLDVLLADLIKLCKPQISIMDGIWCLEGRGPTNGIPKKMDLIMGSRDPVALDVTGMRLIGLNPKKCNHLMISAKKGYGNIKKEEIMIDGDFEKYKTNFLPGRMDLALIVENYLCRFRWFVYGILLNDRLFDNLKKITNKLRDWRII